MVVWQIRLTIAGLTFSANYLAYASASIPLVTLGSMTLLGSTDGFDQEFFGGIPFAQPPIGTLRMKLPVLKTAFSTANGTFDARQFGAACLQSNNPSPFYNVPTNMSEDCLSITVLRPAATLANASLPVMVWIYGGGFTAGYSTWYNGTNIVARGVERGTPIIFVNFNYRLGPLGFATGAEAVQRQATNLGLKDQIAALQWIHENIHLFGGDKSKVTIIGESAGAMSIGTLLLNPVLEDLARGAILQSGTTAVSPSSFDGSAFENRQQLWTNFISAIPQCAMFVNTTDTIPCLQNLTDSADIAAAIFQGILNSVNSAGEVLSFAPIVDGAGGIFPDLPSRLYAKGEFARIPFIAGTVYDEGTSFADINVNYTTDFIKATLMSNFTPTLVPYSELEFAIDGLLSLYPDIPAFGSPYGTGNDTFGLPDGFKRMTSLVGDIIMQAVRRSWIQTASSAGVNAYGYLFADPQILAPYLGTNHGSDITYTFGSLDGSLPENIHVGIPANITQALRLSTTMMDYYISFVTSLDPNDDLGAQRPLWSAYTPLSQDIMLLNGTSSMMIPDTYREKGISFIQAHPVAFHH